MASVQQVSQHFIDSAGGVRIAAYEEGNRDGPTVVLVHGFPDSHVLWDGVVPLLAGRFRVIRYDNRGVGSSSAPKAASEYTMERFADDFAAVATTLCPGRPVHVLAHDWGSVGVWEYLSRPGGGDRVASFTSVSGPGQDQLAAYIVGGLRRPWRPRTFARALAQALRLTYLAFFSVPVLAPLVLRLALTSRAVRRHMVDGIPDEKIHHSAGLAVDAARSVKVYRANCSRPFTRRRAIPTVDVPVQLIVNTEDRYVRPYVFDDAPRWAPRLWRRDIRAGHFSPMSHPQVMAAAVHDFADLAEGRRPARALLRAQVGRRRGEFGDTLVAVTGAGSGIGRETAFAFAARGAELVVSDIDEASVTETAAQIAARGGVAHSYVLDVSDGDAVEAFAERVGVEHGVPDIVVNNAGIGHAGGFLNTPAEEFDRVMDVNFGGVVNGCRSFAPRMVERGTGGHIVNVASMAAYSPLRSLSAYCSSKAAVLMFSDCLRAELDAAGIGLTTICPGVINTNIIKATRIDAPEDEGNRVDKRRGQLGTLFALRNYGPGNVANAIVSSVRKNKPIRPVAPEAYAFYAISRFAPQALRSIARLRVI